MTSLITIKDKVHILSIEFGDDSLSVCLTDLSESFKCRSTKEEALQKANQLNPHIEMSSDRILSIIASPAPDVTFDEGSLKFKYRISGVPFRFEWELTKVDNSIIFFPVLDALLRQKKQILEFRKLPNSDPKLLDQLPSYEGFNVAELLGDYKNVEALSKICAAKVSLRSMASCSSEQQSPGVKLSKGAEHTSPRQSKGALKYQSMKRNLFVAKPSEHLYDASDSSQNDTQPTEVVSEEVEKEEENEEPKKKKVKSDDAAPSNKPKPRLRSTFKL